jgi:hypothetical protein
MNRGRFSATFAAASTLAVFAVGAPAALADDQAPASPTVSVVTPLEPLAARDPLSAIRSKTVSSSTVMRFYLEEVDGIAFTNFGSVVGHEEITGPGIPGGHRNSSNQTITTVDEGPLISWSPDGSVSDGNYCAIFWQKVSGGYSENGPACEYVS